MFAICQCNYTDWHNNFPVIEPCSKASGRRTKRVDNHTIQHFMAVLTRPRPTQLFFVQNKPITVQQRWARAYSTRRVPSLNVWKLNFWARSSLKWIIIQTWLSWWSVGLMFNSGNMPKWCVLSSVGSNWTWKHVQASRGIWMARFNEVAD